ncbi:MAG: FecR family protein [Opitutaceae bacterium]|jgi:hypothetical protein
MKLPAFLAIFGLALVTALGLPAQSVRVIFVSGQASLQRPDESAPRAIVKGETVVVGTRIVTGTDGRVVLTPMPGVKSIVAPNTSLVLESVSENQSSPSEVTHHAVIDLKEGAVVSDLHKPEGVAYDYSIRTARGLAGARGTTFTVGINSAGIQTVVVAHGTISLNFTDGRQVTVSLGHLAITGTDGGTKNVGSISELSPADQQIAQNWAEITIGAIANAIEAGIELDPAALQNALDAAKSLGITLSPEVQALVDRVLALLENPAKPENKELSEIITEQKTNTITGFANLEDFLASLTQEQIYAFGDIQEAGYDLTILQDATHLQDGKFAANLVKVLDLYNEISYDTESYLAGFLTDLGVIGDDNYTAVGADTDGLRALVYNYYYHFAENQNAITPANIISGIEKLDEADYASGRGHADTIGSDEVFFPGYHSGQTITDIIFDRLDVATDVYIGATSKLIINNSNLTETDTFVAGYDYGEGYIEPGFVSLHASDLIDLNSTQFSYTVRSVLMESATINLSNINFNEGVFVQLNSKYGSANFGSSQFGKVNFIQNVSYDGTLLTAANFGDGLRGTSDVTGGHIQIGTLSYPLSGYGTVDAFMNSLDYDQYMALGNIQEYANYDQYQLGLRVRDGTFASNFKDDLTLYADISNNTESNIIGDFLVDLGVLADDNYTAVGADLDGLKSLVYAYYNAYHNEVLDYPSTHDEGDFDYETITSNNVFFPGYHSGRTISNVSFDSQGSSDLYVGATRILKIDNSNYEGDTFIANTEGPGFVSLHAADLVDLNSTQFSSGVGSILIEAATINLRNITFSEGTFIDLNSKYGSAHFGSSLFGYVNFISNVYYGETLLTFANFNDDVRGFDDVTGGFVQINVLGYTPSGYASINAFYDSLTTAPDPDQQAAFSPFWNSDNYSQGQLSIRLRDSGFAEQMRAFLTVSADVAGNTGFDPSSFLTELGITSENNYTVLDADPDGLRALLLAYSELYNNTEGFSGFAPDLRDEAAFPSTGMPTTVTGTNVFFPGYHDGATIYNVVFNTDGANDLYVGATRNLIIDNSGITGVTFEAGTFNGSYGSGSVSIQASDLIDLNNTQFSNGVGKVLIEAKTINLRNITFNVGTYVQLNSYEGKTNFGSSQFGYVNLISNVKYGTTLLTEANFGNDVRGTMSDATQGYVDVNVLGTRRAQ